MRRPTNKSSHFSMEQLEARSLRSATPLADINAGSGSSLPENFNVVGKQVLFLAYNTAGGQMLWTTNGTAAGTSLVKDINPNPQNGTYQGIGGDSIVIGNEMYFTGASSADGVQLWETDGTAAGTQMVDDLNPGGGSSDPGGFTNFNGKLAFSALGQLWITDGTSAGTISLGDFNPDGLDGTVDRMAVLGSELYFMRYNPADSNGQSTGELWETDGTVAGTQMMVDMSPGSDGDERINSEPSDLINLGGELYFAADDGADGWELWQSNGTAAGTSMVDDLAGAPPSGLPEDGSYPSNLTDLNGKLYFTASADYSTPELYTLDPTTGQPVVVDGISAGGPADPQQMVAAANGLFFTADDATGGTALWYSNGTATGTAQIADITPGSDPNFTAMTAIGNELYFTANDGVNGAELWSSNGTAAGTSILDDIQPGSQGSSPGPVTEFNGILIFSADVDGYGDEPFAFTLPTLGAPVVRLADPLAKGISNDPLPVVTGTARAGSTVNLFADGTIVGSAVAGANGEFKVASSVSLGDGKHTLTVSDEMDGVLSAASTPLSFDVDTVHPTASLVSASATSIVLKFSEDVSDSFGRGSFALIDMDTGKEIPKADIRVNYNVKKNTAEIIFKKLDHGSLGTGHYRLRITASNVTDTVGNDLSASESYGFTVRKKKD
jgi:ELWxxDGT repeat protein